MHLNLYFLQDDFPEWNLDGRIVDDCVVAACSYPVVCVDVPRHLDPCVLYVVEAKSLAAAPAPVFRSNESKRASSASHKDAHPSILCCGKPPESWLNASVNLLYADEDVTIAELINGAIERFAFYTAWESRLKDAIAEGQAPNTLAALTVEIFGNPLFVQSMSFGIAAYCLPHNHPKSDKFDNYVHEIYEPTCSEGGYFMPNDKIASLEADAAYRKSSEAQDPMIYSSDIFDFRSLYYNCRSNGVPIARITVDEVAHTIRNRDFALLQVFGDQLSKAFPLIDMNQFDLPADFEPIMSKLLAHILVPSQQIDSLLDSLRWSVEDTYLIFTAKTFNGTKDSPNSLPQSSMSLVRSNRNLHYIMVGTRSVFICNLSRMDTTRAQLIAHLTPSLRDLMLVSAFSTEFSDFKDIYYYYCQAIETGTAGRKKNPAFWIYKYENYMLDIIINRCLKKSIPGAMVPPGLLSLIEHDAKKGTHYVDLLRMFLENERNGTQTARAAFLHRNTFLYQIDRIKEILRMDLDDPRVRSALLIALYAGECDTGSTEKP